MNDEIEPPSEIEPPQGIREALKRFWSEIIHHCLEGAKNWFKNQPFWIQSTLILVVLVPATCIFFSEEVRTTTENIIRFTKVILADESIPINEDGQEKIDASIF